MDIMRYFAALKKGQRHLWLAFRAVFNFLEATGYDSLVLAIYRKALPTFPCGIDLNVPEEPGILDALRTLQKANAKAEYLALYNLLIDSGLRLIEACAVIREFRAENAERIGGFYRVDVGEFRGNKQAFYGYFSESTFNLISAVKGSTLIPG